jgi:hypothetical protein
MDVHPTKNVSIGIDPYPYLYGWYMLIIKEKLLVGDTYVYSHIDLGMY